MKQSTSETDALATPSTNTDSWETATFGQGCFWCAEAIFQRLKGVNTVYSGYSGGSVPNPSYPLVCTGATGHAEVVQVLYDPAVVSYADLLQVFWSTHDPTTLNQQGADHGTQYRSVIFYHNETQKQLAEEFKKKLDDEGAFSNPMVTEISPFTAFYQADDSHQDYYNQNGNAPYCQYVIAPKLDKFEKVFKDKIEYK